MPTCGKVFGGSPVSEYVVLDRCMGNTGIWKECNAVSGWQATDCKLVVTNQPCETPLGASDWYVVLDSCDLQLEVWEECNGQSGWQGTGGTGQTDCLVPSEEVPGRLACWATGNPGSDCLWSDPDPSCYSELWNTRVYVVLDTCSGRIGVFLEKDSGCDEYGCDPTYSRGTWIPRE